MKTIILDIDGTITDMWPVEKAVLISLLGVMREREIEELRQKGVKSAYVIFCRIAQATLTRKDFWNRYNQRCARLKYKKKLPAVVRYPIVQWIMDNKDRFHFVYATGGQAAETRYVLDVLKIQSIIDSRHSISRSNYRFSKATGLPFKKIASQFADCLLVTDSAVDCDGARKAGVASIQIKPGECFRYDRAEIKKPAADEVGLRPC